MAKNLLDIDPKPWKLVQSKIVKVGSCIDVQNVR